jgi:hypothetical protein
VAFKTSWFGAPTMIWVASGTEAWGACALSVAVTEKAKVPAVVGVPDTEPSEPKASPGGTVPDAFQV